MIATAIETVDNKVDAIQADVEEVVTNISEESIKTVSGTWSTEPTNLGNTTDGNDDTYSSGVVASGNTGFIDYQLNTEMLIRRVKVKISSSGGIWQSAYIYGSINGTDWSLIGTIYHTNLGSASFNGYVTIKRRYSYLRLSCYANGGDDTYTIYTFEAEALVL